MPSFWSDIIDDHTGPPLTRDMVQAAEDALGFKLPASYLQLLVGRNGGYPRKFCFPTSAPTSWAADHVQISTLFGVGYKFGIEASPSVIAKWGYPHVGIVIADTPSGCHDAVMLDYSQCGPKGEPRVVLVETREVTSEMMVLAPNFETFVAGLVDSSRFKSDDA
jgi:hypothetical protein